MFRHNEDMSEEDIKLFLDEADELLSKFEENLIVLEKSPDPSVIQETFRVAHTLKGSSATIGHEAMAAVTHEMETVLDAVRKGQLEPNTVVIDAFFYSLDVIKSLRDLITPEGYEVIEVRPAVERLQELMGSLGQDVDKPAASTSSTSGQSLPKADLNGLMRLTVKFNDSCIMKAARAFQVMDAMLDLGRVIDVNPTIDELEKRNDISQFSLVLETAVDAEDVRKAALQIFEIESCEVDSSKQKAPVAAADNKSEANDDIDNDPDEAGDQIKTTDDKQKTTAKKTATVRVDVDRLDTLMNLVAELIIDRSRLERLDQELKAVANADELSGGLETIIGHLARTTTDLQEEIMKARMIPVESVFKRFPRMMRDLSQKLQKEVNFIVEGQETELDRSVVEEIGDPLIHILRNAISHGIESPEERKAHGKPERGTIILKAYHEEGHIVIQVQDDGHGIDPKAIGKSALKKGIIDEASAARLTESEAIELLFRPGFSTAKEISDVSGRGVGLDIVRSNIERLSGSVSVSSVLGEKTVFTIRLPLTLAIIKALLVKISGQTYAIPLSSVQETFKVSELDVKLVSGIEALVYRNQVLPLVRLDKLLHGDSQESKHIFVVVVDAGGKTVSLGVESFIREQEIVVKSLGRFLGELEGLSGMTILGDGRLAPILDVPGLLRKAVG